MVYDQNGNILESYDLSRGYLQPRTIIRPDAAPIDNVKKFAWVNSDYQEILVYIPFEYPVDEPSQLDRIEAQVAYTAMMTGTLMEGV